MFTIAVITGCWLSAVLALARVIETPDEYDALGFDEESAQWWRELTQAQENP